MFNLCHVLSIRPIEESLREFESMRKGKYAASEATLRLKMDMDSPNPNMWDQVAYRIKYVPHPHAGNYSEFMKSFFHIYMLLIFYCD